jgi:hypothetical protein
LVQRQLCGVWRPQESNIVFRMDASLSRADCCLMKSYSCPQEGCGRCSMLVTAAMHYCRCFKQFVATDIPTQRSLGVQLVAVATQQSRVFVDAEVCVPIAAVAQRGTSYSTSQYIKYRIRIWKFDRTTVVKIREKEKIYKHTRKVSYT